MPREPLLVELDDHLWAAHVGLLGRHQVRLVRALPLHQEHQLAAAVRRTCRETLLYYTLDDKVHKDCKTQKVYSRTECAKVFLGSLGDGGGQAQNGLTRH